MILVERTLAWLATYWIHSTLWLAGAWLVARWVRSPAHRARLWQGAVLGGLASSVLVSTLWTSRLTWCIETPAAAVMNTAGTPIVLEVAGRGHGAHELVDAGTGGAVALVPNGPPQVAATRAGDGGRTTWTWTSVLVAAWLVGGLLGLVRLATLHRRLARALTARNRVSVGTLREELERLRASCGVQQRASVSVSSVLASPIALARGEIVVPARALERLSASEREALLAHELAHLVRRDPWWLLALSVIERVLFVQPLNRLATTRSMEAAELACDELAARWTDGGLDLARCLAEVASWNATRRTLRVATGLAERPSVLMERVDRLLSPRPASARSRRQAVLVGAWLLGSLAALGWAGPRVSQASGAPNGLGEPGEQEPVASPQDEKRAKIEAKIAEYVDGQEQEEEPLEALRGLGYVSGKDEPVVDERVTRAIDVLDDCPEAGIAFHVGARPDGVDAHPNAVQEHAFELRPDGTVHCGKMQLYFPDTRDERLLRFHLAEIARCMPKAPAVGPQAIALPDGRLDLHVDAKAPHGLLQRVLEACGTREVQIWKFAFVPVFDGRTGTPLNFALPHELATVGPVFDEPQYPLTLITRVLSPGSPDGTDRVLEYTARYDVKVNAEMTTQESITTTRFSSLRGFMKEAHAGGPTRRVVIDAFPGTLYADVVELMDAVINIGFTDIVFAGRRR